MAVLTVNNIVQQGLTVPAFASPGAGSTDSFPNDGKVYIEARTSGTASTITIVTPPVLNSLGVADQTVVMAATATAKIGPFNAALFNGNDGNATLSYNGTAGLTLAAFRLA